MCDYLLKIKEESLYSEAMLDFSSVDIRKQRTKINLIIQILIFKDFRHKQFPYEE